jgi:hypothetical protein
MHLECVGAETLVDWVIVGAASLRIYTTSIGEMVTLVVLHGNVRDLHYCHSAPLIVLFLP